MVRYRLVNYLVYKPSFKRMGEGSLVIKPMLIQNPQHIQIGDNVVIRNGARIETHIINAMKIPELIIGNNTNIEQNVHIICHSKIHIGCNVSITGNCSIVDTTHPYDDINNPIKIGSRILDDDAFVEIGDSSFIGFGSIILPNVKIGRYVIVGAHSVVTNDIPDYSVVVGIPAKIIKKYDFESQNWIGR